MIRMSTCSTTRSSVSFRFLLRLLYLYISGASCICIFLRGPVLLSFHFDVHAATVSDSSPEIGAVFDIDIHMMKEETISSNISAFNTTPVRSSTPTYQKRKKGEIFQSQVDFESTYSKAYAGKQKRNEAIRRARNILNGYLTEKTQTLAEIETLEKKLIQIKLFLVREESLEKREKLIWARDMDYYELLGDDLDSNEDAKKIFEGKKKEASPKIGEGDGFHKLMKSSVSIGPASMNLEQYFDREIKISNGQRKREESPFKIKRKGTLLLAPLIERGYKGAKEFFVLSAQMLALPITIPTRTIHTILKLFLQLLYKVNVKEWSRYTSIFTSWISTPLQTELGKHGYYKLWEERIMTFGQRCSHYYKLIVSSFGSVIVYIQENPLLNEVMVTFEEYLEPIQWFFAALWKGPLVIESFLFPLSIKGYDRLEAALLRFGVVIGTSEIEELKVKYAKMIEREQKLDYGVNQVYLTLKDVCFSILNPNIEGTSTKICHFKSLSIQNSNDNTIEDQFFFSQWIGEGNEKALYLHNNSDYLGSQNSCRSGNSKNSALVEYQCHDEDTIKSISKIDNYQYILEFGTPLACTEKYINEIEAQGKASGFQLPGSDLGRRKEMNTRPEPYSKRKPFNTKSSGDLQDFVHL